MLYFKESPATNWLTDVLLENKFLNLSLVASSFVESAEVLLASYIGYKLLGVLLSALRDAALANLFIGCVSSYIFSLYNSSSIRLTSSFKSGKKLLLS